jgi:putative membrane protein insertion efficiency factor
VVWGGAAAVCALLLATPYPLRAEMGAIRVYQQRLSPYADVVAKCRYEPTCSQYALSRLETEGFWVGNLRIAGRLAMCSPIGFVVDQIRGG